MKLAIEKVRQVAESEGIDLGDPPVMDGRGWLADGDVVRVWNLLAGGRRQKDVAEITGLSANLVSQIARREIYRRVTADLADLADLPSRRRSS